MLQPIQDGGLFAIVHLLVGFWSVSTAWGCIHAHAGLKIIRCTDQLVGVAASVDEDGGMQQVDAGRGFDESRSYPATAESNREFGHQIHPSA